MGAGHAHPLHLPGNSPVHRLAAHVKIVVAFGVVCCVVATPREALLVFAGYPLILAVVWVHAGIPLRWIGRRALIEVPFVVLAVLLPFAEGGVRTDVLGLSLSVDGLYAGWAILVKGTLGVLVSLTLAATTAPRELLLGLQRLRMPDTLTTIATLMLRYLDVLVAEAGRMRVARISRGHDPRFLWQLGATARGVGALFLRSYERGERVHLAMLSRGWTGAMPVWRTDPTPRSVWAVGSLPLLAAIALVVVARWPG